MDEETSSPVETQVDRTVLSWARTAAMLAVVALLFGRWADELGPIAFLPATLGVLAAILIRVLTRAQAPLRRTQFASGVASPPLRTAVTLCLICVMLAGAGLLAVSVS